MKKMMKGFTLVEIMIVVAIIAILAAVAIPNFVRYRKSSQATACKSTMKQIQAAYEQAKMEGKYESLENLYAKGGYLKSVPTCPCKGTYTIDDAGKVTCSYADTDGADFKHELDQVDSE